MEARATMGAAVDGGGGKGGEEAGAKLATETTPRGGGEPARVGAVMRGGVGRGGGVGGDAEGEGAGGGAQQALSVGVAGTGSFGEEEAAGLVEGDGAGVLARAAGDDGAVGGDVEAGMPMAVA